MSVRMEPTLERKLQFLWMLFWHNSLPLYENTGWPKGIWHLLNGLYSVGRPTGEMRWSAFFSSWLATSVTMETWPVEHRVNDRCSKHVSRTPHFPFRRRAVAPLLTRSFNVWFFPLGVFEIAFLHSQIPYVDVRPIDLQLLARFMEDFKKRLENFIQEDRRHPTDIIFKT